MIRRLFSLRTAAIGTLACLTLLALRRHETGNGEYGFLPWNLFLAWLPAVFALAAERLRAAGASRLAYYLATGLWLVFLPNAPYLVTDFVHLGIEGTGHLRIDLPMLTCASIVGMIVGMASLRSVHAVVEERLGVVVGWLFVGSISALTGLGVYLGRVQRFNSWQVVSNPGEIVHTVLSSALDPAAHSRALAVICFCSMLFATAYVVARNAAQPDAARVRDRRSR